MNIFQQIFTDHYEYIQYVIKPRPIVMENIEKMIHCGAYFNAGRLKEAAGDFEGAKLSYQAIADLGNSNDSWNDLAKTRLLDLENKGKIK